MVRNKVLLVALCLSSGLLISSCTQIDKLLGGEGDLAPVAPSPSVAELWCYRTIGAVECYPKPLIDGADRLVNVQPSALYPQTREEYMKRVAQVD